MFPKGCCGDGTIVDMDDNDDKLTGGASSEIDGLVDRALATAALLQTIQCLLEATDFIGVVSGFKAWRLPHVDNFVISLIAQPWQGRFEWTRALLQGRRYRIVDAFDLREALSDESGFVPYYISSSVFLRAEHPFGSNYVGTTRCVNEFPSTCRV